MGKSHVEHRQFLRQPADVVHHDVVAHAEDARDVAVCLRIEAHAISIDAVPVIFIDRFLGVEHQVLRVMHIDVGRLTVGDQQD